MNNAPWTTDQLADVSSLPWTEFQARHGTARSYDAWRHKRRALHDGHLPVERTVKIEPVVEDESALDADTARALLQQTDEHLFQAYLEYQDAVTAAFPFSKDVSVAVDTTEPIGLVLMSDWHIGSEGTDIRRLKADIDVVCSHPRLYVGLGGDVVDNFILSKMGSAARTQTAQVQVQWRLFRHLMQPLLDSHSLLWVSSGNHDQWTEQVAAIDPILAALGKIPVAYTGEGAYVDLRVGPKAGAHQTYTVWRKHRPVRFRSGFNLTHFLKQIARIELPREFDIGVSEHLHTAELNKWTYRRKERILVNCGSYKIRDRWAEGGGFYSGGYAVPTVVLYPSARRMLDFSSISDALELLDGPSIPIVA